MRLQLKAVSLVAAACRPYGKYCFICEWLSSFEPRQPEESLYRPSYHPQSCSEPRLKRPCQRGPVKTSEWPGRVWSASSSSAPGRLRLYLRSKLTKMSALRSHLHGGEVPLRYSLTSLHAPTPGFRILTPNGVRASHSPFVSSHLGDDLGSIKHFLQTSGRQNVEEPWKHKILRLLSMQSRSLGTAQPTQTGRPPTEDRW